MLLGPEGLEALRGTRVSFSHEVLFDFFFELLLEEVSDVDGDDEYDEDDDAKGILGSGPDLSVWIGG